MSVVAQAKNIFAGPEVPVNRNKVFMGLGAMLLLGAGGFGLGYFMEKDASGELKLKGGATYALFGLMIGLVVLLLLGLMPVFQRQDKTGAKAQKKSISGTVPKAPIASL
jgi:hypothetical protein